MVLPHSTEYIFSDISQCDITVQHGTWHHSPSICTVHQQKRYRTHHSSVCRPNTTYSITSVVFCAKQTTQKHHSRKQSLRIWKPQYNTLYCSITQFFGLFNTKESFSFEPNKQQEGERKRESPSVSSQPSSFGGWAAGVWLCCSAREGCREERSVSTKECLSHPPASCAALSAVGSSSASRPAAAVCTSPGPGAAAGGPAAVAGLLTGSCSPAADAGTLSLEWTPPAGSLWSYGYRTDYGSKAHSEWRAGVRRHMVIWLGVELHTGRNTCMHLHTRTNIFFIVTTIWRSVSS